MKHLDVAECSKYYQISRENFVYHNGLRSVGVCLSQVFSDGTKTVVIFTEVPTNRGPSVTNAIENIVEQFCKIKDLNPREITILERYAIHPYELDLVILPEDKTYQVSWKRLSSDESKPFLTMLKMSQNDESTLCF